MKPNIMSDMMATHRRNMEALAAATRLEFEGAQALARRNTEIMRQAMAELADAITAMACAMTPDAKMAKRAELTKVAYERTVANIKELHDLIRKVNAEALDLLNRRFSEGMDEVKALIRQSGERRHP